MKNLHDDALIGRIVSYIIYGTVAAFTAFALLLLAVGVINELIELLAWIF